MIKANKGISLVSLIITIAVMMIIASITINISFDRFEINNLNKMLNDLELLEDKVSNYYLKYDVIPVVRDNDNNIIKYTYTTLNFDKNAGDNENYYIIDLKAMEGISLNYGEDGFYNPNTSDDVYIINEKSHSIYYVRGIELDNEYYHSILENTSLNDNIPPSKPEIKIISGTQNDEGVYTTDVSIEIIPGKDNWSGVNQTISNISKDDVELTTEEIGNLGQNNIYTISENGVYIIKVKTQDNSNNFSEEVSVTITINKENVS